jgi:hypothetical protein
MDIISSPRMIHTSMWKAADQPGRRILAATELFLVFAVVVTRANRHAAIARGPGSAEQVGCG